ncbi:hypothetical protein [Shewanella sp. 10N.286.48.A6]|uniref:hypothetical protein n=1 Tax=Shewanella sp. 10N.286.48.A6 TaxID=1880833 RepID=UPI000C82BCA4|nr:hypothetical protein [Shewanella sp. 10N.286.48.A6]PMH98569.1 hypothetical protein BCU55_15520 [Shewanella sp. 10N.286.48.A6]
MSEPVGPTSTNQWHQFEVALLKYAQLKDWQKVEKVNELMMLALSAQGKPKTQHQLLARRSLAKVHQKVIGIATAEKQAIATEMKQFHAQQDGLAAYELTNISGNVYDK